MKFNQGDRVIVDHAGGVKGLVLKEYLPKMYEVRIFRDGGSVNGEIVVDEAYLTLDTDR